MSKNQSILTAVRDTVQRASSVVTTPAAPAAQEPRAAAVRQAGREDKAHISAWVSKEYKRSLRLLQVRFPEKQLQELICEALDDIFAKYDVPVVNADARRPKNPQPRVDRQPSPSNTD